MASLSSPRLAVAVGKFWRVSAILSDGMKRFSGFSQDFPVNDKQRFLVGALENEVQYVL